MPFASSETPGSPSLDLPAARQSSDGFRTILYAATIFLGAFLLFLIEPLLAKLILPLVARLLSGPLFSSSFRWRFCWATSMRT